MAVSARAHELFLAEMARRGVAPEPLEDGGYRVVLGEMSMTVSLENKGREFDETGDEAIWAHFVDTIMAHQAILPTSWEELKPRLFWSVEPSDSDFGDACRIKVSDQACLVLVYQSEPAMHIIWMTPSLLESLGASLEHAEAHAHDNLAKLMDETPIETTTLDGHTLGMLSTHSPLKASLIFARNLRQKVEPWLSWPILAVIPNRDFAYLMPQSAREILGGIGRIVVAEYTKRGYPITTEVFEIDSEKVVAIGEFQSPLNPPKGMKAIKHDEMLTIFLPHEWDDDVGADGETVYFDPSEEENYLRVSTQKYTFKDRLPDGVARGALSTTAEEEGVEVEDLPGNRAVVRYEGEDEDMHTWIWAVCGPVTERALVLVVFTYHLPADEADSPETEARLAMLNEMLPRALFRPAE